MNSNDKQERAFAEHCSRRYFLGWEVDDAECVQETEKAILVVAEEIGKCWVPKTQVRADSEVRAKGDQGLLIVSKWFATKEGWAC